MTIAAIYLSPEGVVFGADSTASAMVQARPGATAFHFFNHNQKLFQIGEESTLGVVTWGLGGLRSGSYRTLLALLADELKKTAPSDMADVVTRWNAIFWPAYCAEVKSIGFHALSAKAPFVAGGPTRATIRTKDEEEQFAALSRDLVVGFCIGGYVLPDRTPAAY